MCTRTCTFKIFVRIYAGMKESSGIYSLLEKVWTSSWHHSWFMLETSLRCWWHDWPLNTVSICRPLITCHFFVLVLSESNLELQNFTCIEMTPTFWPHPWFITTNPVYFSFCRILVYFDVFDYFGLYFIHFNDRYFRLNTRSEIRPTTPGHCNSNRSNIWEILTIW